MRILEPSLVSSLQAARDEGIAPAYFVWVQGRDRTTGAAQSLGFWSGDDDVTINVQTPEGGLTSKTYIGGCNLAIEGLQYVADLTDGSVTIGMSQISPGTQQLVRGYDVRLGYVEVHATTWNGGVLSSRPQLQWIGIVDDAQIATPAVGGDGAISLTVRSEIMSQLTEINPAKSSDTHQERRSSGDQFSRYSGMIRSRKIEWGL